MKYRISTEHNLPNQALKKHLQDIIEILTKNKIEQIIILFGFAWGNEFNNWREMELNIKDIFPILSHVENQNYGKLGKDDFIFRFRVKNFFCEFNICHHGGIDWEIVNENEQFSLFSSLLDYFKSTFNKISCEREIINQKQSERWEPFDLKDFKEKGP